MNDRDELFDRYLADVLFDDAVSEFIDAFLEPLLPLLEWWLLKLKELS